MKWLLSLATRRRRWASQTARVWCFRSPLWMALALLLAACGQAVAAAPIGTTVLGAGDPVTPTILAPATANATHLAEVTPSRPPPTPLASDPPDTATPEPSQAVLANQAGPSATAAIAATATPTAQAKAQPTLGAFSITPLACATLVTPNPTAVSAQTVGQSTVNIILIGTDSRPIDPTFR